MLLLGELLENMLDVELSPAVAQLKVRGLTQLHADVQQDWVFVALAGECGHGLDYLSHIQARAAAVLYDAGSRAVTADVPLVPVPGLRAKLSSLGQRFYQAAGLQWIGITGTNGKSSVAHLLGDSLTRLGRRTAVVGTVYKGFGGENLFKTSQNLTTPDILSLHRFGYEAAQQQAAAVALECSSHGLAQGRIEGLNLVCGVFTNLTAEHRDYHKSLADYESSKYRLFEAKSLKYAVINRADEVGAKWLERLAASQVGYRVLSYGTAAADIYATEIKLGSELTQARVVTPAGSYCLRLSTSSFWGVSNALAALGVLLHFGYTAEDAVEALSQVPQLAGRMQQISAPGRAVFIVDYAHTPAALKYTLASARARLAGSGKLWVVFGCGGERDTAKRPEMGAIAAAYADQILLTNDNPRGEEPQKIVAEIKQGLKQQEPLVELERAKALDLVYAAAAPGDLVVIAGKGHETYQEIAGVRHEFSDFAYIKARLEEEAS